MNDPTKIERWITKMGQDRRTEYLPDTLAKKYQDAVNDGELLNLRTDMGLIEIRLSQLMAKIETGDPQKKWAEFKEIAEVQKEAFHGDDPLKATYLNQLLLEKIDKHLEDYQVWKEIRELMEDRRRLVESESNRLVRMQEMISAEDATHLLNDVILQSIKRHVKDPQTYAAIAYDIAVATGAAPLRKPESGGREVRSDGQSEVDQGELLGSGVEGADTAR